MPIEDFADFDAKQAPTPTEEKNTTNTIDADLDAFFGDAASVARDRLAKEEATKQSERPEIRSELTESGATRVIVNERGRKVIRGLVASAAGLGIAAAGIAGVAANNAKMEDSKVVVGTDTFMPSFETGETWGEADAATNKILKDSGVDPNKISYQEVGNALEPALTQEKEVSQGSISPGATFDATVYKQTGLFGDEHYSVNIDSSRYLSQKNSDDKK